MRRVFSICLGIAKPILQFLLCCLLSHHLFHSPNASAANSAETSVVWVDHDAISPLPGQASEDQLRFLPIFVFTDGGCLPASALDADGRVGSGLNASGKMNGGCLGFDQANIYTQTLNIKGSTVFAYGLYFPKDGSNPNSVGGHRHDWEHVLVWTHDGIVDRVTFFQHAGYYTLGADLVKIDQTHPIVYVGKAKHGMYHARNNGPGGFIEGLCYFCDTRSDPGLRWLAPHRLLGFESLTAYQQEILQMKIWGDANSPFRTDNFPQEARSIQDGALCRDRGCKCDLSTGSCPGFP